MTTDAAITWGIREVLSDAELQDLFSAVYKRKNEVNFHIILANSLSWVSARRDGKLVGFANIIWDGLYHALIVDRAPDQVSVEDAAISAPLEAVGLELGDLLLRALDVNLGD